MRSERVGGRIRSFDQDTQPKTEERVLSRRGSSSEPAIGFIERSKRTLQVGIKKATPRFTKKTSS